MQQRGLHTTGDNMHTVELLEQAKAVAEQLGHRVRQEWLGGDAGGGCEFSGQKWIFIDVSLPATDQLDQIVQALREDDAVYGLTLSAAMSRLLGIRRSA